MEGGFMPVIWYDNDTWYDTFLSLPYCVETSTNIVIASSNCFPVQFQVLRGKIVSTDVLKSDV